MNTAYFLPPDDTSYPETPRLERRAIIILLAMLAGCVLLGSHKDTEMPVQKPGPRKYPPAYWGRQAGDGNR